MIKIKLLITTSLLILLIPILDKRIRLSPPNPVLNQQGITTKAANEISQIIRPAEATNHEVENIQTQQTEVENNQTKPSGFCLNVPVLMYHHVQPQNIATEKWQTALNVDTTVFESQMTYLTNSGYQTINLDQLAQALLNHQQLPPKSIALTFDDSYRDFYTFAFPIIKKYNLRANLFISTGLVENSDYLTWSQLKEMVSSNQVFAYNHTWSHANMASVPQAKMESEVQTAQKQLVDYLGTNPKIFAYPYGTENSTIINVLRENGFIAALSTIPGQVQCDSFIMTLHRTRIGNSTLAAYGI